MNDDYKEKNFALILAAIASGSSAEGAIAKAREVLRLLGYEP